MDPIQYRPTNHWSYAERYQQHYGVPIHQPQMQMQASFVQPVPMQRQAPRTADFVQAVPVPMQQMYGITQPVPTQPVPMQPLQQMYPSNSLTQPQQQQQQYNINNPHSHT
jgi:hypothetical protein